MTKMVWGGITLLVLGLGTANANTVDDLRWMAGSWASDSGGVRIEEHWMAPVGGMMVGMHRDVVRGRAVGFEFFRIQTDSAGTVYLSQPHGQPPTPFRLKVMTEKSAVFENPEHDFPQRLIYWLDARGDLNARVEGLLNGKLEGENWRWKKTSLLEPKGK